MCHLTPLATRRLFQLSGGAPRKVNQLAQLALLAGASQKLIQVDEATIEAVQEEIYGLAGHPFNVGSPKQLQVVLFEELGLQSAKRTPTGMASTNVEVLEELNAVSVW